MSRSTSATTTNNLNNSKQLKNLINSWRLFNLLLISSELELGSSWAKDFVSIAQVAKVTGVNS